ncbi:hypothetical protein BGZ74_003496 [Mortierella antarctica]|nr:hypothetical protein BGZ74_003496 [Mortierella antarctica]
MDPPSPENIDHDTDHNDMPEQSDKEKLEHSDREHKEKPRGRGKGISKSSREASGYLNDAASQIDAQFEDILGDTLDDSDVELPIDKKELAKMQAKVAKAGPSKVLEPTPTPAPPEPKAPTSPYKPRILPSTPIAAAKIPATELPPSIREPLKTAPSSSSQPSTINPTTKPSANISNEDEWEWVEETEYVVLDFGATKFTADLIAGQNFSLVNLDSPSPFFRSGAHVFKGFYDENAITEDIIFDMKGLLPGTLLEVTAYNDDDEVNDSDDESPGTLDLVAIATKRLIFEQVEVLPAPNDDDVNDMIASGMNRAHAAEAGDIWGGPSLTLNGAVKEANKKHNELQERKAALSAAAANMSIAESPNANMEVEELEAEDDAMGV